MTDQNIAHIEQLVPVFSAKIGGIEVAACDARALHTYLESGYLFANWIKDRIEKYEFLENKDFILIFQNPKIKSISSAYRCGGKFIGRYDYLVSTQTWANSRPLVAQ